MRIATRLAGIELEEWTGARVRLGSLWGERACALFFIRHFG